MSMMAEGEPPQEQAGDTMPESPQEDAGEQTCPTCGQAMPEEGGEAEGPKASQQEVNYREGNPQRSCGLCADFDSDEHTCKTVEGSISPYGFCDIYKRQDNPFREGEKEGFKGGKKVAVVAPIPPMGIADEGPPGLMQIGRQAYG